MDLPDDPDVIALLPMFCADWEAQLRASWWPNVLAARDREELRRLGHTLKGSFAQFGLPRGAELGAALLACAREGDFVAAAGHVDAVLGLLEELRRELPEGGGDESGVGERP